MVRVLHDGHIWCGALVRNEVLCWHGRVEGGAGWVRGILNQILVLSTRLNSHLEDSHGWRGSFRLPYLIIGWRDSGSWRK